MPWRVLLGVTGSVAAVKAPVLYRAMREQGWDVKVVATQSACAFFDPGSIESTRAEPQVRNREVVILDEDEWPSGQLYVRGDEVLHIELRRWADLLVIAPLDANTMAKLSTGICDNCLTCVWRAWDSTKPVVLAPAMNTLMWQHPTTRRHLRQIAADAGLAPFPEYFDESALISGINQQATALRIVPPQLKQLACGDVGVGALADVETIVAAAASRLPRADAELP